MAVLLGLSDRKATLTRDMWQPSDAGVELSRLEGRVDNQLLRRLTNFSGAAAHVAATHPSLADRAGPTGLQEIGHYGGEGEARRADDDQARRRPSDDFAATAEGFAPLSRKSHGLLSVLGRPWSLRPAVKRLMLR